MLDFGSVCNIAEKVVNEKMCDRRQIDCRQHFRWAKIHVFCGIYEMIVFC